MQTFSDDLDTSSYPRDSERDALKTLYSSKNAKVLGKFKDECNGTAPLEFVGLRSKMYSLLVSRQQAKITAKKNQKVIRKKTRETRDVLTHSKKQIFYNRRISILLLTKPHNSHAA